MLNGRCARVRTAEIIAELLNELKMKRCHSMAQLGGVHSERRVRGAANLEAALCRRKNFFFAFFFLKTAFFFFFLRTAIQSQSLTLKVQNQTIFSILVF